MSLRPVLTLLSLAMLSACPPDQGINPIPDNPDDPKDDTDTFHTGDVDTDPIPDDVLTGGVKGRICAPSGWRYIVGARVSVEHQWGVASTFTDADGWFVLDNIPAGEVVVTVDKGSFHTFFNVLISPNEVITLAEDECLRDDLNIAVVTGEYDSIEAILKNLDVSFTTINGVQDGASAPLKRFLTDPADMGQYDIIFFNCGLHYEPLQSGGAESGPSAQIVQNIKDFVANGGSIYASDWAYFITEPAFPEMIDFRNDDTVLLAAATGAAGAVTADVYDPAMQASVGGNRAEITFDLDVWVTPQSAGPGTSTLIYSQYQYWANNYATLRSTEGPLAVRLDTSGGRVIFTSFHNEPQVTLHMEVLLEEIIFSL
jgi:SAM-dependent methyltransferase